MPLKFSSPCADTQAVRHSLRLSLALTLASLVLGASTASAASSPTSGFVIFKDMRTHAVTEIRDKVTGSVVTSTVETGDKTAPGTACGDSRHKFFGARWISAPSYVVNRGSFPSYLSASLARAEIVAAQEAWENPFTTDCSNVPGTSRFNATDRGGTTRVGSLVAALTSDGSNVVAFQSLAGTICDGALACVVVDYTGSKINEADLAFETDLTRYGFQDFWTTDSTTWTDAVGGRFALSDVGTHEWGHFAGLGHVLKSPRLTMFPFIHDGAETLGLGDMKGLVARYS